MIRCFFRLRQNALHLLFFAYIFLTFSCFKDDIIFLKLFVFEREKRKIFSDERNIKFYTNFSGSISIVYFECWGWEGQVGRFHIKRYIFYRVYRKVGGGEQSSSYNQTDIKGECKYSRKLLPIVKHSAPISITSAIARGTAASLDEEFEALVPRAEFGKSRKNPGTVIEIFRDNLGCASFKNVISLETWHRFVISWSNDWWKLVE